MSVKEEAFTKDASQQAPPELFSEWAPWSLGLGGTVRPADGPPVAVKASPGPAWELAQVLKAAHIVSKPPRLVQFRDEYDMRATYALIYDVFRFKSILNQAIDNMDFFEDYPEFAEQRQLFWLFLMDLARRRWMPRARPESEEATRLLQEAGPPFSDVERIVWDQRVHFAAAIARIRIKNRAFSLVELLPPHLREERVSTGVNRDTVSGWVNTYKAYKVGTLIEMLHKLGFSYSSSKQLYPGEYRFDRVCPRFITLRPVMENFGQVDIVQDGMIVLQEREFCEGASTLCRVLRARELQGVVAQTHASSPRCSAYLAAQLRELGEIMLGNAVLPRKGPQLGRLIIFGAGDEVSSYITALGTLGIEASPTLQPDVPVCVLSEAVHADSPTVVDALQGVVAVLATPPNTYSAVSDPIDLVCGRGGDIAMLETLTESLVDEKGKIRDNTILDEQRKTLLTLMSQPKVQVIIYETHSSLNVENQGQVTRAIEEANERAIERHKQLSKNVSSKFPSNVLSKTGGHLEEDQTYIKLAHGNSANRTQLPRSASRKGVDRNSRVGSWRNKSRPISPDLPEPCDLEPEIVVSDCDLFEVGTLPILGNGLDLGFILDRDGCYLSLIQRKNLDLTELEQFTKYEGYTEHSRTVKNFWSVVHSFSMQNKQRLLRFTTGSDYVPLGEISKLKLVIMRNGLDSEKCPLVRSYNVLLLPDYVNKEKLQDKLLKAISNCKG